MSGALKTDLFIVLITQSMPTFEVIVTSREHEDICSVFQTQNIATKSTDHLMRIECTKFDGGGRPIVGLCTYSAND